MLNVVCTLCALLQSSQPMVSIVVYYLAVMCVARYKSVLDSIEKEKSETVVLPSALQRTLSASEVDTSSSPLLSQGGTPRGSNKLERKSLGDDISLTSIDVWDGEEASRDNNVFSFAPQVRSDSHEQEDSVCSSLGSASDLHNHSEDRPANFFGPEGALHPPTVMQLTQAIDVSEQVWCVNSFSLK